LAFNINLNELGYSIKRVSGEYNLESRVSGYIRLSVIYRYS